MNLGIAELWALRIVDCPRSHLEEALALARRAERPLSGDHLHRASGAGRGVRRRDDPERSRARRGSDRRSPRHAAGAMIPIIAPALAIGRFELVWLGRFEEAERWLERAQRVLAAGAGGKMTEVVTQHATGLLCFARGAARGGCGGVPCRGEAEGAAQRGRDDRSIRGPCCCRCTLRMGDTERRARRARRAQRRGARPGRDEGRTRPRSIWLRTARSRR